MNIVHPWFYTVKLGSDKLNAKKTMSLLCFHLPQMWRKTNSMAASAD